MSLVKKVFIFSDPLSTHSLVFILICPFTNICLTDICLFFVSSGSESPIKQKSRTHKDAAYYYILSGYFITHRIVKLYDYCGSIDLRSVTQASYKCLIET